MPTHFIEYLRIALYVALVIILLGLFQAWDKDHPKTLTVDSSTATVSATNNYVPHIAKSTSQVTTSRTSVMQNNTPTATANIVHITTDVIQADINSVGGNIIQIKFGGIRCFNNF